jgi:prepilin-type N-terminal cleavage/methylation domain-containing protein
MPSMTAPVRRGFTLIEMLVVMGIMLLLFAIGVAFLPGMYQRNDGPVNAAAVQRLLVKARTEARTYNKITGVIFNPGNPTIATAGTSTLAIGQYPDDIVSSGVTNPAGPTVVNFPPGAPIPNPGDILVFDNIGVPHRVAAGGPLANQVTLQGPLSQPLNLNSYRIIPQWPVPELGGEQVQLVNSGISLSQSSLDGQNPCTTAANPTGYNAFCPGIFFAPGGYVVNPPGNANFMSLFVSDPNGPGLLVVVYSRTGVVAIQPVDPTVGGNPYNYANDPRPSGL